ncbi:diguanylate cyclase [Paraglaciecola chathamensis]|uniref:sensor domain-containing diguanylate cyclase n=1 Tax=Paraglaciecola chathamensis TaxID=368405 RepID=UPI002704B8CE|nr:diguanylate cyclase [Paraglaciecola chathamensis]MDO6839562.1 diguanylate cyclase [Paraglaciecola chathamensis]
MAIDALFRRVLTQRAAIQLMSATCILLFLITVFSIKLQAPEQLPQSTLFYLDDSQQQYQINTLPAPTSGKWQALERFQLALPMSETPHWVSFTVASLKSNEHWLLELNNPFIDHVSVWFIENNQLLDHYQTGDSQPFASRVMPYETFLFPVPKFDDELRVVMRISSEGTLQVPIHLWAESDFLVFNGEHSVLMGLFFGILFAMGISNLFFFVISRQPVFLLYAGYVLSFALLLSAMQGLGYKYIWSESPWMQKNSVSLWANATVFYAIVFTNVLLDIKSVSLRLHKTLNILAMAFAAILVASVFVPKSWFLEPFLFALCGICIFIYAVSIWGWYKKVHLARFYTLAWTSLLLSCLLACLEHLNLISLTISSNYLLMLGVIIETFLLALMLALSVNHQRRQLFRAQKEALRKEREMRAVQDDVLAQQNNAQEELEYSVQERTLELEIALRELSEINRELEEKNTLDALTGIRNRRYFDKKYLAEVRRSRRERTELVVAMIDIDHFKKVNDEHGHLVGDDCIKFVAERLKKTLKRPSDDVCRYGGEEFSVIMPSTDIQGAHDLLDHLRLEIQNTPVYSAGVAVNLTVSIGLASAIMDPQQSEDVLIGFADQLLYQAKNNGRNCIVAQKFPDSE